MIALGFEDGEPFVVALSAAGFELERFYLIREPEDRVPQSGGNGQEQGRRFLRWKREKSLVLAAVVSLLQGFVRRDAPPYVTLKLVSKAHARPFLGRRRRA